MKDFNKNLVRLELTFLNFLSEYLDFIKSYFIFYYIMQ